MVHSVSLEHLEEEADDHDVRSGNAGSSPVSWVDSMRLVQELLKPAQRPENLLVLNWRIGDIVLWDNRCVQHAVTPTHKNGPAGSSCYAALGERRLMTRTSMQPSWVPTLVRAPARAAA